MITVNGLIYLVIYAIVLGLIFYLLKWLIDYINPPEPFKKVANVALVVIGVLICIALLLSLVGRPLIVF